MLREIFLKNFVLIKNERFLLSKGLNVLSGETGAGKTVLTYALELIAGAKANEKLIGSFGDKAQIEAVWQLADEHPVTIKLKELELYQNDEFLVIRRVLDKKGANRIFINDHSVSLLQLKDICSPLMALSSQNEQYNLTKTSFHQKLLDHYLQNQSSKNKTLFQNYQKAFEEYKEAKNKWDDFQNKAKQKKERLAFLDFQLKELKKVNLENPNLEDALLSQRKKLRHQDQILNQLQTAQSILKGSPLLKLTQAIETITKLDPQIKNLDNLTLELEKSWQALLEELNDYSTSFDQTSEAKLDEIEAKLFEIQQIQRRFGRNLKELIDYRDEITNELNQLNQFEKTNKELVDDYYQKKEATNQIAYQISKLRQKTAPQLESTIQKELKNLAMPHAQIKFQISQNQDLTEPKITGIDKIELTFAPNPGLGFQPLAKIASGGELARVYLTLCQIINHQKNNPTMVFDEIDQGLSAQVAFKAGKKIKQISQNQQVLCITHHAQVACFADHHLRIQKETKNQKTQTFVWSLTKEKEQTEALAKMLANLQPSSKVLAYAKELWQAGHQKENLNS